MYISRQRPLPGADFTNPALVRLPVELRFLTVAIRAMADSAGRGLLDPKAIRRAAFPRRDIRGWRPTIEEIETWMLELDEIGWLEIYPTPTGDQFQILAPLPALPHEPRSVLQGKLHDQEFSQVQITAVERERAGVSESARAGSASPPPGQPFSLGISPARFCPAHPGGPPPGITCADCGTARNRHGRHLELRAARQRAAMLEATYRSAVLATIDAELRALEEADGAARASGSVPVETPPDTPDSVAVYLDDPDQWDPSEF